MSTRYEDEIMTKRWEREKLPPVERLQAVRLEPGDVVVATLASNVTADQVDRITTALRDNLGCDDVVVTVGVDLTVYRPWWRRVLRGRR